MQGEEGQLIQETETFKKILIYFIWMFSSSIVPVSVSWLKIISMQELV